MQDMKTLRLASLQLTQALLEQYLRYQRALLKALASHQESDWAGRFAFAHGRAMQETQLELHTLQKVKAVVGDYCGKRTAVLAVKGRLEEATVAVAAAKASGTAPKEKELQVIARAEQELPALESEGELENRYGAAAMALLRTHEVELVALHRELSRVEGAQHLHRG